MFPGMGVFIPYSCTIIYTIVGNSYFSQFMVVAVLIISY